MENSSVFPSLNFGKTPIFKDWGKRIIRPRKKQGQLAKPKIKPVKRPGTMKK